MIYKIKKNKILNFLLIAIVFFAKLSFSMSNDKVEKIHIANSMTLVERCARYIINNDIKINFESEVTQDLEEYLRKIKEIESRRMPERLKALFLSIVNLHSLETIIKTLSVLDKIDSHLSQEESDFLKDSMALINQILFKYDPYFMVLNNFVLISGPNFFKKELEELIEYYRSIMNLNKNDLQVRYILWLAYSINQNHEEALKLLIDTVNDDSIDKNNVWYHIMSILLDIYEDKNCFDKFRQLLNFDNCFDLFDSSIVFMIIIDKFELLSTYEKEKLQNVAKLKVDALEDKSNRFRFIQDYLCLAYLYYLVNDQNKIEQILEKFYSEWLNLDLFTKTMILDFLKRTQYRSELLENYDNQRSHLIELLGNIQQKLGNTNNI